MSRSLQYARTDRDITEAFLKLLESRPFEKITVGDIIEGAMINRSTFYQHYPDKYAVLEVLQKQYLELFLETMQKIHAKNLLDLDTIDHLIASFFLKNRQALDALLRVRTENFDLEKQWKTRIAESLGGDPMEAEMMASLAVSFFIYCMEHEDAGKNFSSLFFESMLDISLRFFGLSENPRAREDFLALLSKYTKQEN